MKYKSLLSSFLIATTLFSTSCKDEFADINTNPSVISEGNITYFLTQSQIEFNPSEYAFWYYNGKYTATFAQSFIQTGGLNSDFNIMGATGDQGTQVLDVLNYAREMDHMFSEMEESRALQYKQIRSMLNPMMVVLGLHDTDLLGDMAFTEAMMARYTNPMLLTPKYDRVADLYDLWLNDLDESIAAFTEPVTLNGEVIPQMAPGAQDLVYRGDVAKWARLANSLKLKIAVRLLHQDRARALRIAEEVANSSAGVLNGLSDDLIYNKGRNEQEQDQLYGTGNNLNWGAPNKEVVDFMVKNQDPRVRFAYTKNGYNSRVIQAFFDEGRAIPAYIMENVDYDVVDGKNVFRGWKGTGEPWVRYYGLPIDLGAAMDASVYGDYYESNRWKIGPSTGEKTFAPYARFNEEMVRGRVDFTLPTPPGGPVIQDLVDSPWYGMYMSTAEVNLYLAEFKLLGANLPKSAQEYYNLAVEMSVRAYDHLAGLNHIPYYGTTYDFDPFEAVIDLKDGEIATLMASADYQLTGSAAEQLEKVYIQQYLHFLLYPNDQFVSVRRSGVPKVGSSLIAWKTLIPNNTIPRRLEIGNPSPTDLMYDIKINSLIEQNFTGGTGVDPALLNSERLWQDQGAPNFGEGPNF